MQAAQGHHKNFGKVPAYLNKYKEEAETLAQKREDLKAKRALPKGMRQVPEDERIATLEDLTESRKELNAILQTMPISLQSNGLK